MSRCPAWTVEVCRRIRSSPDAYIIMVTARTEEIDRVVGLTVGADDYVTKPFSPGELAARIAAMRRRPRAAGPARRPGTSWPPDRHQHARCSRRRPGGSDPDRVRTTGTSEFRPAHAFTRFSVRQRLGRWWRQPRRRRPHGEPAPQPGKAVAKPGTSTRSAASVLLRGPCRLSVRVFRCAGPDSGRMTGHHRVRRHAEPRSRECPSPCRSWRELRSRGGCHPWRCVGFWSGT